MSITTSALRRPLPRLAAFAVVWLLASCGGGSGAGSGTPQPSPGFELQLGAPSVLVSRDSNGLLRVRVTRRAGFSGAIEVGLANPPAGVSADTIVIERHEDEVRLPLRFGADVPLGALGVVLNGRSSSTTGTANLQLDVQPAQPNSQQLIQDALDAWKIDLGTALLYRAYAVLSVE